jgi:Na+/melibiose symporter-like transporter
MLGRVMALNSIAFLGTTPIGMLFVGGLAATVDTRSPFWLGGVLAAVAGAVSYLTLASRSRHESR